MKIRYSNDVELDLARGYSFYERKQAGLGRDFLDTIYSSIESLHLYYGIHIKMYEKHYWLLADRFSYTVFYRIENDVILIDAVFDCRQDPAKLEERLL